MNAERVVRMAWAIAQAIDEGELLAGRPADKEDAGRHEVAVALLEIQRSLLERAALNVSPGAPAPPLQR